MGKYKGKGQVVVKPKTREEVARVVSVDVVGIDSAGREDGGRKEEGRKEGRLSSMEEDEGARRAQRL